MTHQKEQHDEQATKEQATPPQKGYVQNTQKESEFPRKTIHGVIRQGKFYGTFNTTRKK